jgi:capsular polysaccharide biosynthesis protein
MHETLTVTGYVVPETRIYTAASYLVDRLVFQPELLHIAADPLPSGEVTIRLGDAPTVLALPLRRRDRVAQRIRPVKTLDLGGRIVFDMRHRWPENWAHFLMNHLPPLAVAATTFGLARDRVTALLPAAIPANVRRTLDLLGIPALATDAPVRGVVLATDIEPLASRETGQRAWASLPFLDEPITGFARRGDRTLPRRAFISRRKTRALGNESEIEALLATRGFTRLYAEDLPPESQVALFHEAEAIVAIHGAALGPLLYRAPDSRLRAVIELMPCGHMSLLYRVVAWQVGCAWTAVRGRIKPAYLPGLYDRARQFEAYSLDDFTVDPDSLALALADLGL